MAIPEPTGGFWGLIKGLMGWIWPQAPEEVVRAVAARFRLVAAVAEKAGTDAAHASAGVMASWGDAVGADFATKVRDLDEAVDGAQVLASDSLGNADFLDNYAATIENHKMEVLTTVALGAAMFAASFLLPPPANAVAAGGAVRTTVGRLTALGSRSAARLTHPGMTARMAKRWGERAAEARRAQKKAEKEAAKAARGGWWGGAGKESGRQGIPKRPAAVQPGVKDTRLGNILKELYKGGGRRDRVGDGTTMDAVRNERRTGDPTGGKYHTQKAEESLRAVRHWIRDNPDASVHDRWVAQKTAERLQNALRK